MSQIIVRGVMWTSPLVFLIVFVFYVYVAQRSSFYMFNKRKIWWSKNKRKI
jgi:uncharacterized membrane protein